MAAAKAIMSIRRWAFLTLGDEQAVQFVAMATPEDLNANAEFIRQANGYVEVPGGKNSNNYANVKLILDIAARLTLPLPRLPQLTRPRRRGRAWTQSGQAGATPRRTRSCPPPASPPASPSSAQPPP